jgi:cell division protease FtsH
VPPTPDPTVAATGGKRLRTVPIIVLWLIAIVTLVVIGQSVDTKESTTDLTYSEFLAKVDGGGVKSASIDPEGKVKGDLTSGDKYESQIPTAVVGEDLGSRLEAKGIEIEGKASETSWLAVLMAFAPILLLVGFFVWMMRRSRGAGGFSAMQRSKARVIDEQRPNVRFADVAGYEGVKSELSEVIEFLRDPARFKRLGANGPKGVLMLGPPGTGKTLFARAIAGEANVPFLSVTGSTFVELFVGVGAARVRDLFEHARRLAPAIVFIDEIDAVGQRRGASVMIGNDEREQTLNQLLAEMDGFDSGVGVVVLAATNRPDVLDTALLRPGRFDRHIVIPLPNREERAAILDVHCRNKPLAPDVNLDEVARGTPGFSGADLANLANEAAIAAVRRERDAITREDFGNARDRILLGRRERSSMLLPAEKRAVAAHEAGHALVAALSEGADPVTKVTILPSGPALGATEQLPLDDRHLYSESFLLTALAALLGGRAGELVAIGEASSGAADDLAKATEIATRMVRELGMSVVVSPVGYPTSKDYLGIGAASGHEFSDATQRAIDAEVAGLVIHAQERAEAVLRTHRSELDQLMAMLLEQETVDGDAVYGLIAATATATTTELLPAATAAP